MKLTNVAEVEAYLKSIPESASEKRKWQAVTTATRALLRSQQVPDVALWRVEALPPQAYRRYGDCSWIHRRIRYKRQHVVEWWTVTLAHTIAHEAGHAITSSEMRKQGKRGDGGHGPMWRGVMATLEYSAGRARNLPNEKRDAA